MEDFERQRLLEDELDRCEQNDEDFADYAKGYTLEKLQKLYVQNINDIRVLLKDFFRLRDYRARQQEQEKNSLKGMINSVVKKKKKSVKSSKNFEHMDLIIEEYIRIEYI